MKKFLSLFAAAALLLSMAGQSFGAEVKLGATGFWQHLFTYDVNSTFDKERKEDKEGKEEKRRGKRIERKQRKGKETKLNG